jgi:hypothetical protein
MLARGRHDLHRSERVVPLGTRLRLVDDLWGYRARAMTMNRMINRCVSIFPALATFGDFKIGNEREGRDANDLLGGDHRTDVRRGGGPVRAAAQSSGSGATIL